jgi:RNA polymerase sigma-70 factor (ECF subfamily)
VSTATSAASSEPGSSPDPAPPRALFVTTHWSQVLAAANQASPNSDDALETLCRAYWYPLYAYVRRRGHSPDDAEDLTQAFFARLLEKNWLADADRERGRFRSFLLASLKHFLANEWDKAQTQKRGGRVHVIPLETAVAETRYQREPADEAAADKAFDRRWALALLDLVLAGLRDEYHATRKGELFEQLRSTLAGERAAAPYAEIAARLRLSEGAVKVAVHRLRQRYREILREEIAHTVETPAQVEEELRHLFAALAD